MKAILVALIAMLAVACRPRVPGKPSVRAGESKCRMVGFGMWASMKCEHGRDAWWCSVDSTGEFGYCTRLQTDCERARTMPRDEHLYFEACLPQQYAVCLWTTRQQSMCAPTASMCQRLGARERAISHKCRAEE